MWLLGAFPKLQQTYISFVMSSSQSVRQSVNMKQLDYQWTDFYYIYLSPLRKSVLQIQG